MNKEYITPQSLNGNTTLPSREEIVESIKPIKERAESFVKDMGSWVKKNPVASAGIALSAGVLIGRVLMMRSRKN